MITGVSDDRIFCRHESTGAQYFELSLNASGCHRCACGDIKALWKNFTVWCLRLTRAGPGLSLRLSLSPSLSLSLRVSLLMITGVSDDRIFQVCRHESTGAQYFEWSESLNASGCHRCACQCGDSDIKLEALWKNFTSDLNLKEFHFLLKVECDLSHQPLERQLP